MYRAPANPATDATFTTDPCLRITIAGRNACVQRNVPVAFTASTRFQSSSVILPSGALCAVPALLTRISTTPARRAAAWARPCTLAASVTSHGTAHALPPPRRISSATFSMRSALRAATTIAAPSAASARATAAPIPWPPPVTRATEPSNRGKDRLFEDRPQGLGQACTLVSRRGRRITEGGARPARFLECSLACCDRLRQRDGIGSERLADAIADRCRPIAQDDRALELTGVTRTAPELLTQPGAPRFPCEVRENDRQETIDAAQLDRLVERGEMLRIEMRIGNGEQFEALPRQAAGEIQDEGGDGDAGDGKGTVEGSAERRGGVRERRENHDGPSTGGELLGTGARHRGRDHDVGVERQMRPVGFDGPDREQDERARAVEIAYLLPRQLRQIMYRHHHPFA